MNQQLPQSWHRVRSDAWSLSIPITWYQLGVTGLVLLLLTMSAADVVSQAEASESTASISDTPDDCYCRIRRDGLSELRLLSTQSTVLPTPLLTKAVRTIRWSPSELVLTRVRPVGEHQKRLGRRSRSPGCAGLIAC